MVICSRSARPTHWRSALPVPSGPGGPFDPVPAAAAPGVWKQPRGSCPVQWRGPHYTCAELKSQHAVTHRSCLCSTCRCLANPWRQLCWDPWTESLTPIPRTTPRCCEAKP